MGDYPCTDIDLLASQSGLSGFKWLNEAETWRMDQEAIMISSKAETDFFRSPRGAHPKDNAPFLYYPMQGDFSFSARIIANLKKFGDAGGLTIRQNPERWAKICIEKSPSGEINIVSVVTSGYSDDANNELLGTPDAFLRITRTGSLIGLHYSLDGKIWRFARTFRFEVPKGIPLLAGIHVQSPYSTSCSAVFRKLVYSENTVENFKSGE